ncbi:hypothetical protein PC116_g32777 [Phytophthora cactorum]|nr:hypothetical protein PC116_g32777 [Phytophthora cactorum]
MAPLSVGMTRREHKYPKNKYTRVDIDTRIQIEIWGSNLTLEDITVDCVVKAWDVETGRETYSETVNKEPLVLSKNQSTEIIAFDVPEPKKDEGIDASRTVVAAYLVSRDDGRQLARYVNWPEPLKYLHLAKPTQLRAELSDDLTTVNVSAEVPVKGVAVESEDDDIRFEDNLVDIVPGEVVNIKVRGAKKDTVITTRHLGMI